MKGSAPLPFLKGTVDMLVLKALSGGPMHGFGIALWLEARSDGTLGLDDSVTYQVLHRLEGGRQPYGEAFLPWAQEVVRTRFQNQGIDPTAEQVYNAAAELMQLDPGFLAQTAVTGSGGRRGFDDGGSGRRDRRAAGRPHRAPAPQ